MSCDIRRYNDGDSKLCVTAFVGLPQERSAVQFTIGNEYYPMLETEVWDLIETLIRRLHNLDGYTATRGERDDVDYESKP